MRKFAIFMFLSMTAALAGAQVTYYRTTNSFTCPSTGGFFCVGPSLSTNIIIRCTYTVGQPGNCNDNLAGIPPQGVKISAPCYEPSPKSGLAACSYDNIAYPNSGAPFPIPSNSNSSTPNMDATTPFANSSSTSNTPTTTSAASVNASSFVRSGISIPAGPTPSVPALGKQYVPNPNSNGTGPIEPSVTYTGAVWLGVTSPPQATFTGGIGKVKAGACALGMGVFGVMAVFA